MTAQFEVPMHSSVDAAAEYPLSYGQLYSRRELETYPVDWLGEANLPATCDLRGHRPGTVLRALRLLADRHEALRTEFVLRDGVPVQVVLDDAPLPVSTMERPVRGPADAERATGELLGEGIPLLGGLCWRGRLVTSGGQPVFLSLSFSHLIVDVWSVRELQRQLTALLRGDAGSGVPELSPRSLAATERAEAERRHPAAARYWDTVLSDPRVPTLPAPAAGAIRPRIQATLHSHRFGGLAAAVARRHGVTVPAVVLSLVAAGLARHTGSDRVALGLMSSNRFRPEHRLVVSTMNQLIPVVADVDRSSPFGEYVTRLNWASAKAYRNSRYDIDRIAGDRGFTGLFPAWFNYLQLDDVPGDPGQRQAAELEWTPRARPFGQPFDVRVTAREGRTSLALRTDPHWLPAGEVLGLLRRVAGGLEQAAHDPGVVLGDLLGPRGAAPSTSLFPADPPSAG